MLQDDSRREPCPSKYSPLHQSPRESGLLLAVLVEAIGREAGLASERRAIQNDRGDGVARSAEPKRRGWK